ncbi:uncharacterized protein [Procambarus clarkii]|uniref:uncharacterized protein isoform X2 n=1 Tax=Procambarus clarkii TaxID=6728 RepID=UPI003742A65C
MSHNGTLNISRDDVGEVTRVFILKNGGGDPASSEGQGVSSLSRTPSISANTGQHGVNVSDSGGMGNCDSENVINGMLRTGEDDVDPSTDLGADLQHIEEWLKTRSDSLSSFDFDPEIKPSEVDVNDFFNLKTGVQFHVSGQDYGLVFSKDNTSDTGASSSTMLPNQFSFPDLGDTLGGAGSRRSSFTKKLETLMQVDKGLFEELLLTDPNKKYGNKKSDNLTSLPVEDRGLFEELLLPGAQEEWARHAQELLLAVTLEKRELNIPGQVSGENEPVREPVGCSVPVLENTQEMASDHETSDELDLMVRNIQPIKLMSPQEIENMASRPLGFDETPIKTETQRNKEVACQMEDFNFIPFGARGCEDNNTLPSDLLTSPNSEVDSKLSSILAMDASNDTLEIPSSENSDMLENLGKMPPKLERSISPGTFLVKLEPRENRDVRDKVHLSTVVSTSSQLTTAAMPPPSTTFTSATASFQPPVSLSILNVNDIINSTLTKTSTTTNCSLVTAVSCSSAVNVTSVTNTTTTASVSLAPKGLLKIPSGSVHTEVKKLPIGMVQLRLAAPPPVTSLSAALTTATTTLSPQLPRPTFILRPLITSGQQLQQQPSQQHTTVTENLVTSKESTPLTFTPLKMVAVQPSNKPGIANVTITVDRKANLTTVNIVSSNNEHTVFKINTCDLVRAVSSIREPHLEPLGLTPQQLLRSAHTAHRLIQEVHQQGVARQHKGTGKDTSSGPQNFEINQPLQEVKPPISRMQQGQLAMLRQAAAAVTTAVTTNVSNTTSQSVMSQVVKSSGMCNSIGSTIMGATSVLSTANTSGSVLIPTPLNAAVLSTVKGAVSAFTSQKVQAETTSSTLRSERKTSRLTTITKSEKSHIKNEGVGVSLRPGAPPTMVSVPSVLDSLSASSLVPADLLQTSSHSPSSTNVQSDDDLNEENPEMCTVSDEVANKAFEELGIHIDSLQCEPSPQGGKHWLCPIKGCCKHFPKLSSLKVHLLSHNGIRPYKCSYESCDWAFYTWYKLKRHIETHLKRRDYVCSESNCNRRFTTVYNLNTHLRLHQRPKCWMCSLPECTQAFHTRRELEVHMKTHKDVEAPYKCGVDGCSKSYFTPNSLTSHMRSHHKEEELRCQWAGCGKKFDKPCRLKAHMRVHTGQRPFVCTFEGCNWSFQSASKLSRHQRKHTNDHCNAKFTAKSSLYVHLKKHEGKTKDNNNKVTYHCPIDTCDKSYNSKFNLRQHMLKIHTILTTDTNQLDYITLLGDKDLMMDQLLPLTAGGASSSSVSLDTNVPSSTFSSASPSSDAQATLLSSIELINGEICADGNSIAPIIVMEGRSGAEAIDSMDVSMADTLTGTVSGANRVGEVDSLDMTAIAKDATEDIIVSSGSARTDVLGNVIRSHHAKKRQQINLTKKMMEFGCHPSCAHSTGEVVSFTNDVVLSSSAVTMSATSHLQSALLQDDGVTSELYQETLMGHDLLSDPSTDPQSTINLRDLE